MTQNEHNSDNEGKKRVQVSFTRDQWKLIEQMKGNFGSTDADAVRNIVISWLSEKSFISTTVKEEMKHE
ncbi:MAG: CopG family transcriptional regulator [Candidatus Nanohaloarchaea archaeon]